MRRRSLLSLLGLLLGLATAPYAAAQSTPGAAATPEAVLSAALAPLGPGAHVAVYSRASLAPGASLALGATAGPAFTLVMSGSASVTAQSSGARVVSAGAGGDVPAGASAPLDAGALLLLDMGASVTLANAGDAPAQIISAVVLPAAEPASATPAAAKPLFTDPVALPGNAIQVVVSRLTLPAGAGTDAQSADGPRVLAIQSGTVVVSLNPGKLRVLRANGSLEYIAGEAIDVAALPTLNANDSEDRETIEAQGGSTIQTLHAAQVGLAEGDAGLLEAGGAWTARNPGSSPAEILSITLAPAPPATPSS
jgi:hypothetical protein